MGKMTAIVDFEASSLWGGYPIEVGFAKFDVYRGRDIPRDIVPQSRLIRHEPWLKTGYWCENAHQVHNISKDDIDRFGRSVREVAYWLNQNLSGCDVFVDSDFDEGWNDQLFKAAGIAPSFNMRHVREIFDDAVEINDHCVIDFIKRPAHRAGPDAERIARTIAACVVRPADLPELACIM